MLSVRSRGISKLRLLSARVETAGMGTVAQVGLAGTGFDKVVVLGAAFGVASGSSAVSVRRAARSSPAVDRAGVVRANPQRVIARWPEAGCWGPPVRASGVLIGVSHWTGGAYSEAERSDGEGPLEWEVA